MIKKILVAIDGSNLADEALDHALELAENDSAELTLLSVIPYSYIPIMGCPPCTYPIMIPFTGLTERYYYRILSKALTEAKKQKPDLIISGKLVAGDPANKIVEVAKKEEFDLIVIGSHSTSGLKRFFFGSTSDSVSIKSEVPVLLIK